MAVKPQNLWWQGRLRLAIGALALISLLSACSDDSVGPVIIDTDMGFDDVRAILLLLESEDIEIAAVTVTGNGLARCPQAGSNARAILDLYGLEDVPVACGSPGPLQGSNLAPTAWRDGADALEGMALAADVVVPENAPELIVETVQSSEELVRLLVLGPLTNLAKALALAPDLKEDIAEVRVMGGAVDVGGNILDFEAPVAEFNIWFDPLAAHQVFTAGLDVTLVPLDATNDVPLTTYFYDVFGAEPEGKAASLMAGYVAANPFFGGVYHWDDLAAATLLDDSLVDYELRTISVVIDGAEQGRTFESAIGDVMQVAVSAEQVAFEQMFYETLTGNADPGVPVWEPDGTVTFNGDDCVYDGPDPMPPQFEVLVENSSAESALGVLVVEYEEGTTQEQIQAYNESNPTAPPPFFNLLGVAPMPYRTSSVWSYSTTPDSTLLCVLSMTDVVELAGVRIDS